MGVNQARNLEKENSNKERAGVDALRWQRFRQVLKSQWRRERIPLFLFPLSLPLLLGFTRLSGNVDVLSAFPGHASTDKGSPARG